MSRALFLLREALVNLRRNALVVAGAVLAVFISLTLAFGALAVNRILATNTVAWQEGVHVIAWLRDEGAGGAPAASHGTLLAEVRTWEEVKEADYIDKAGAWEEFQIIFAGNEGLLSNANPSLLPASIRIELVDIAFYRSVQFRLSQQQQTVREVAAPIETIEQLKTLSGVLNVLGIGLSIVLGLSAVILIANTIRLAIYARRDEVAIMKLVGASNWFIRVPFLIEGLIEGVVGAALAVFTVWVAASNLENAFSEIQIFSLYISDAFFLQWGLIFLAFGAAAGVVGSLLGLSRYLREADGAASGSETTSAFATV